MIAAGRERAGPIALLRWFVGDRLGVVLPMYVMRDDDAVELFITAGTAITRDEWGYTHIPKRELVSTVQVHLQNATLKWPDRTKLPPVQTLEEELGNFQYKITAAGNDTYNAREGAHDDILLALALALWQAARPGIDVWGSW